MSPDIETLSKQLIEAVSLIMNPYTPITQRNEAHKMLEDFRDKSPYCADCGFFLSAKSNSSEVRHFGLQLIEHFIKLHWNSISPEEKLSIKDKILEHLTKDIASTESNHIKIASARIIVEIIKREWPQQWPSLLDELHNLCIIGDVQTELVLLIFLRLAEDIVILQNVPDKRRREVYKALCNHLKELFNFFLKTLSEQCEKYYSCKNMQMQSEAFHHCHIVCVTLETLSVFLEWIPINYISEEPVLMKQLCHLLGDENLQNAAVKCLLSLVDRRGKPEDRIPILKLFEENELFILNRPTCQPLDQYHNFLKIYCQTLAGLGSLLSSLMGPFKEVKEPQNFPVFINCVLSLTQHPSVVISHLTQSFWTTLLRDQNLSKSPAVIAVIPNLLKTEATKLFKIGYPSKAGSKASEYSLIEFDSDEDFEITFSKFRSEICEVLKIISKQHSELAFNYFSSVLKPLLNGLPFPLLMEIENSNCLDILSIWETLVYFTDAICIPLMKNAHLPCVQNLSSEGIELLRLTLTFHSEDLYIQSYVLSYTSGLVFFANFCPDVLPQIFEKIFSYLANQPVCDKKASLPKEVVNIRRHACSLLIKLATNQSKLLLPSFDHLCHYIKELIDVPEHLSPLEKCALLETVMILSYELYDYEKQLKFIHEMVSPTLSNWLTDEMKMILSSPDVFIAYCGLNESPDNYDATSKNRAELLLCTNVLKTCAKRCRLVTDPDKAKKGNFIHPLSEKANTILYRNPSAQLLVPAISGVFYLMRTLHSLHDPATMAKVHPSYISVVDISESDKNNILGNPLNAESNQQPKTSFERMKSFLQNIYDNCLHTLGDATENLSIDFYMLPNLSNYFTDSLFHCIHNLPNFKLRAIIRTFLKPFFYQCPVHLFGDLVNVLNAFCNFMFEKLSALWQRFKNKYGSCIGYEDQMNEIEEVLEDQLNRLLTREYFAFLGALLQSKPVVDSSDCLMDDDSKEQQTSNSGQSKQLSELGLKIFQTEAVRGAIVCTLFEGLHWLDTVANVHCISLCELVFKQLLKDNLIQQYHEANYLLQNALYGLQELGQHESNQGLLLSFCLQIYEKLRPPFPELKESLISTVDCDKDAINRLEGVLSRSRDGIQKSSEKQKKEAFRNVVKKIIGKNISQYHKREIVIKNLPPMFVRPKMKKCILEDSKDKEDVGLCTLFDSSN